MTTTRKALKGRLASRFGEPSTATNCEPHSSQGAEWWAELMKGYQRGLLARSQQDCASASSTCPSDRSETAPSPDSSPLPPATE